jgi:tetratricopeptide (TPR) repeat protein
MSKMNHPKTLNDKKSMPKIGKIINDCLTILSDEIQLAVTWSRPSILLAVHRSKSHQEQAIVLLEQRLATDSAKVVHIIPSRDQSDILGNILQKPNSDRNIFFIHGMGKQNETYTRLNLHREIIVENQLKLLFWLTSEECISLSRRAPDFWAFRHRVIGFPPGRSSQKLLLPSGVLLWHEGNSFQYLDMIGQKIATQENIVQSLPENDEAVTSHINAIGNLAYLYWLKGENHKAENLFRRELENITQFDLNDLKSFLLNGQAISYYDRGAYLDALASIEEALAKSPEDSILWANHGIMCRAAGQSRKSLTSIKRAIRLKPEAPDFWGIMGYMYMSIGRYDAALPLFEKALNINPANAHFRFASAICSSQIGDFDQFEEALKWVPVDTPDDNSYLMVCHDYLKGNKSGALIKLKEMVDNKKIPQAFLSRDPSLSFIFNVGPLLSIT